ncbi:hypothetical protein GW766_00550 [Candidatus Parcubacteria bacterium]|nr:hypothetical protein [Candidatus Parcubacteria bacterium]
MRILFISKELIGGSVLQALISEGNDVKVYIENIDWKSCLDGIAHKIDAWEPELSWVGKSGLIVFDDVGWNNTQDVLRREGYSVFGGNMESDALELNRQHFQDVLSASGVKILP